MKTEQLLEKKERLELKLNLEKPLTPEECDKEYHITIMAINQNLNKLPEETRIFLNDLGI